MSDQRLRGEIAEYLVETLPSLPTALHMLELELAAGLQSPA